MDKNLPFSYNGIPIEELEYADFRQYLLSVGNREKAVFEQKIVNTKYETLGLYSPQKDALFSYLKKHGNGKIFTYPDLDFETTCIKGRLIASETLPFEKKKEKLLCWLESVDSWAHTDSVMKGVRIKDTDLPLWISFARELVSHSGEYFVRFGIILLMSYCLTDRHIDEVFSILSIVKTGPYYVDMALAWLCATALISYKEKTLCFLKNSKNLNDFTIKKTFQKARESFRISAQDKAEYLNYQKDFPRG